MKTTQATAIMAGVSVKGDRQLVDDRSHPTFSVLISDDLMVPNIGKALFAIMRCYLPTCRKS